MLSIITDRQTSSHLAHCQCYPPPCPSPFLIALEYRSETSTGPSRYRVCNSKKLGIWNKTGLLKLRKLVFSQNQESLRSRKTHIRSKNLDLIKIFQNLIRSDDQCNQSEVAICQHNEMGSNLKTTDPTCFGKQN